MDLLYQLQLLRETAPAWVNAIPLIISEGIVKIGVLFIAYIYWCKDKRLGSRGLLTLCGGVFTADLIKPICAVPRPFVQDARLHAAPGTGETSSGYSFPSVHTVYAGSCYGTIALWQKKRKLVTVLMIFLILATAFSRMYLGCHTLPDVCVSLLLMCIVTFIAGKFYDMLTVHPKWDVWVMFGCLIAGLVGIFVVRALNRPAELVKDFYGSLSMLYAAVISWVIERRFVGFDEHVYGKKKLIRFLLGTVIFSLLYLVLLKKAELAIGGVAGMVIRRSVSIFCLVVVYPWMTKKLPI